MKRLEMDRVWWLISPGNPLKPNPPAEFQTRLTIARELAHHPRIEVVDLEARLGSSYTIDTLEFLARRHPEVRFIWLMGADNLAQFHKWRRWRDILSLVPVAVLDRPGHRLRARAAPMAHAYGEAYREDLRCAGGREFHPRHPRWTFLTIPLHPLSSTALRGK